MRLIYLIVLTFLQLLVAFLFGVAVYMFASGYTYPGGFDNFIGLALFQPLWAILLSGLSVLLCWLVGLPIRVSKKLNDWWSTKYIIPILLFVIGLVCLFLSFTYPQPIHTSAHELMLTPNRLLIGIGWFLTLFSLIHFFPPKSMVNFLEKSSK